MNFINYGVFFKIQTRMFHRSRPIEATVSHDAWHCNVDTENANINVDRPVEMIFSVVIYLTTEKLIMFQFQKGKIGVLLG